LFEIGSLLLFFGVFNNDLRFHEAAQDAILDLSKRGYTFASGSEPIRIYPAEGEALDGHQAGGWRPGIISVRPEPQGNFGKEIYLRHELMHEAVYRKCGAGVPIWAQEAAAIAFSGETKLDSEEPSQSEIALLKSAVRADAPIRAVQYETLRKLVSLHGWPQEPCKMSDAIARLLETDTTIESVEPSVMVMSVLSGRILFSQGDIGAKLPPGSLLKIPYAASLETGREREVTQELLRSDTDALSERSGSVRAEVLTRLLHPIVDAAPIIEQARWRELLGERDASDQYPIETDLPRLGAVLRQSLLEHPKAFAGLTQNGQAPGSTLSGAPPALKQFIRSYRVIAKTGSASNALNSPLVGSLFLAWPSEDPLYLAVVRAPKMKGAGVAAHLAPLLPVLREKFPPQNGKVRVRILSRLDPSDLKWSAPCNVVSKSIGPRTMHLSECGEFEIETAGKSAREKRWFRGLLEKNKGMLIVETDPETYADGVLEAEADGLKGQARAALRAVIYWNGIKGRHRHPAWGGVCDLTHCMVNLGASERLPEMIKESTDPVLLELLSTLSRTRGDSWLSFSKGGVEKWEQLTPMAKLRAAVGEEDILAIQRERTRTGEVKIHLAYPASSESVPCEIFRARLKLPSCPDEIIVQGSDWIFRGAGAGHGEGLDVDHARRMSESGKTAKEILIEAYQTDLQKNGYAPNLNRLNRYGPAEADTTLQNNEANTASDARNESTE